MPGRCAFALLLFLGGAGGLGGVAEPPLGRAVEPTLPLPSLRPDPVRLERARAILAPRARESTLSGYLFLTDLDDAPLLARAAVLVEALESIYFERYGRRPVGTPREAIVLFSCESDYRLYQAGDPRISGLTGSTGLAGSGIVATYRGARSDDEMLGTLVHELSHLLNRRAIGPSLPSWLDEGIADDLGSSRIDPVGRLLPGTWSRALQPGEKEIRISGGEAALRELTRALEPGASGPAILELEAVLDLEWEEFVAPEGAELNYALAAAFVRMLLAEPAQNALLRSWLAEVSQGASPRAEELRQLLGRPWSALEMALATWMQDEMARLPALLPPRDLRSRAAPEAESE